MLNLDTNIIIRAAIGDLKPKEEGILRANADWGVSSIVLWEITKLHQLKRIDFGLDHPLFKDLLARIHVLEITNDVCRCLYRLDFRSDPADEIIAATSIANDVPLLTRDRKINRSSVVPLAH